MIWYEIEAVSPVDTPFTVWIEPWGDPADGASAVKMDCTLDATGNVVDVDGNPVANVTHWLAQ